MSPPITLFREIYALGGVASSQWEQGYAQAIYDVLTILEKRGFSEHSDPAPDASVKAGEAA